MRFPRQEYWSGLPFPPPGDLPNPGIEPRSPVLAGGFFTTEPPGKPSFKKYLFILFLAVLGLHCCQGFSLVAVLGLLIAVASLWSTTKGESDFLSVVCGLSSCRSWALVNRLSSCGIKTWFAPQHVRSFQIRDQTQVFCIGGRFFTTEPPGKACVIYFQCTITIIFWQLLLLLGFSLVAVSRGYSLAMLRGILTVVASLVVEHEL